MADRAAFFIDGFNLYHAIDDLDKPHLKWLDLWSLSGRLIPQRSETLVSVIYCSALATHMRPKMLRHRIYIAALEASGVKCVMGKFKRKPPVRCNECGNSWRSHEEKESDVNLAIHLLDGAHLNAFDHAYLVTADSDLRAAVRMCRERFPDKKITSVAPPGKSLHAGAIAQLTTGKINIDESHLAASLFPKTVPDKHGAAAAVRPDAYTPPDGI